MARGPLALIILDGFGLSDDREANAVALASTPVLDRLLAECPNGRLHASGEWVGLPDGQMGNSEVGHLNLGAGRVVYQDITKISKAIRDGDFFTNPVLIEACERGAATVDPGRRQPALHLMGLVSDGGVHSHLDHLKALVTMAEQRGVKRLFVHAFLDGRDVPPRSAVGYLEDLQAHLDAVGVGKVATVIGRYWAMDRDNRWDRVKRAYDAMVRASGERAETAVAAVEAGYARGEDDEFLAPTVVTSAAEGRVTSDDSVIFFNFRPDRARELTRALSQDGFEGFYEGPHPPRPHLVCMTQYDATFDLPVAFRKQDPEHVLADVLAEAGLTQVHIAETEKYAHVTFFFNGGSEPPKKGEERILVPSPKVPTYDQQPEMSARGVADAAAGRLAAGGVDVLIVNFANPDMVGHTGLLPATIAAIEAVDACVGRIEKAVKDLGGEVIVTGDHGNAEKMLDAQTCEPFTAHTTDDVPFIYAGDRAFKVRPGGALCDVAPTMLDLLGIQPPPEMTGVSLLVPA